MQVKVVQQDILKTRADAWIVNLFEGVTNPGGATGAVDKALGGQISRLIELGEFTGKLLETAVLYPIDAHAAKVIIVGLGEAEQFTLERVRQAAGAAFKVAAKGKAQTIATIVHGAGIGGLCPEACAQATIEGCLLASYRYEAKGVKPDGKAQPSQLIVVEHNGDKLAAIERGVSRGQITAQATNLARTLVNTPANFMTPTHMAATADKVAAESNLQCEILERADMEQLGMGCLLGVAQGSAQPPKLIALRYAGNPGGETVALVGKGITFDSGGISIKPSAGMEHMKNDMAGGAAVISAMQAIGKLKPKVNILGVVACTENLPSGTALKPGDVIEAMTGQTVEIVSTDAEGRLILADAVAYAEHKGASKIIDVATLTGAIGVALGDVYAGLVSNNDELVAVIEQAAQQAGERFWRMPVHDDYRELYKSEVASLRNGGVRGGGAITGGMIISEFIKDAAWAHLDIASMASGEKTKGYAVKGGTGFATRTLIQIAENLAQK
ncbi:MAG TPA: leucyl aminopeptidase [Firmicutes bacterium]|nr:leucyl aminopeptidase [Bacillota bacterium]